MTTQSEDVTALRTELNAHVQWDVSEHALLRRENEVDYRTLIAAINDLRTSMQNQANKVIWFMCGGLLSITGAIIVFVVPHIK